MRKMKTTESALLRELETGRLYLDGAMGSLMQSRAEEAGLDGIGTVPEILGITHPELIRGIHRDYVDAGADIVLACTFGANRYKLEGHTPYTQEEIVTAALENVRASGARYAALDIGPIGSLVGELGDVSEDEAYSIFSELAKAGEKAGADLVVIETMTDIAEARIALMAANENTSLPVMVSMTFEENGRTLTGTPPEVCGIILESLGADIVGTNCSTGPVQMLENAKKLIGAVSVPVAVQPNAGLPVLRDGETAYDVDAGTFSDVMKDFAAEGAAILGGCCGSTPEYIRLTREKTGQLPYRSEEAQMVFPGMARSSRPSAAASAYRSVVPGSRILAVGESINPTADKKLKEALRSGDTAYAVQLALMQKAAGADILDINVGVPGIDEAEMMEKTIRAVTAVCDLPLQIDSTDPEVVSRALRIYPGRAILNSVNGDPASLETILPVVAKYGAMVIGLTLDENGIPETADQRIDIARKIIREAGRAGVPETDILIDCLVMTASTSQKAAGETLEAVRRVSEDLGRPTTLGVSNISFGLPQRSLVNRTFLAAAFQNGLDTPIISVLDEEIAGTVAAFRVLDGEDRGCAAYTRSHKDTPAQPAVMAPEGSLDSLAAAVADGLRDETIDITKKLLKTEDPMRLVEAGLMKGLDTVGDQFETGEAFLPNLLFSAEAVQGAFDLIKSEMPSEADTNKGTIMLAAVEGDVHDIGKNILKVIIENYGYEVIDLGKDVPVEAVAQAVVANDIRLLGLSALMTTTVRSMKKTIEAVRAVSPETKIMVGGAVLTEDFAQEIGADYYGKDAKSGVEIARRVFGA